MWRRVQAGTRWRRLRFYYQSPGCRQGMILAPVTAWRRLPGSGGTWPLDILVCSAARWPPRTTGAQANQRTIRAPDRADETTPPGHGPVTAITAVTADHGDHGRSRPATAVTAGRGRAFRTRGHGPGVTNQARTGRVRVRTAPSGHDLSTAVTAVVTAAAAPPGYRPGAPGAAPTRSSARWRVNGEPGLRGGDRRGGGNHHPIQGLEVEAPSTPHHPRRIPNPGNE